MIYNYNMSCKDGVDYMNYKSFTRARDNPGLFELVDGGILFLDEI